MSILCALASQCVDLLKAAGHPRCALADVAPGQIVQGLGLGSLGTFIFANSDLFDLGIQVGPDIIHMVQVGTVGGRATNATWDNFIQKLGFLCPQYA